MFLERITLKNIKCFESLEIDFKDEDGEIRHKSVLLGINGTGKSTVLRAIALITSGGSSLGELIGNPKQWVKKGRKSGSISATLRTIDNKKKDVEIKISNTDSLTNIITRNEKSLLSVDKLLKDSKNNYFTVAYGVSRRTGENLFRRKSSNYDSNRSENVATLFSSDAYLFPLESWLMETAYFEGESSIGLISDSLNKLLPNIEFNRIDKSERKIYFSTPEGEIDYESLSDGYKITANWFGDLLYRIIQNYKDYNNPLDASFLLLIDEVGLHLHPSWQRKIMVTLSNLFKNAQIVSTTHSPFVAQQCDEGELYTIMQNTENKKTGNLNLYNFEGNPGKLLINQIVMSDIFGLKTDESVYVENLKTKYESLKQDNKTQSEEYETVVKKLSELPTNLTENKKQQLFSEDYQNLMSKIKNML